MLNTEKTLEKLVALSKGRGFVYAGSEIYGGMGNTWDYGPVGVEIKNNILIKIAIKIEKTTIIVFIKLNSGVFPINNIPKRTPIII